MAHSDGDYEGASPEHSTQERLLLDSAAAIVSACIGVGVAMGLLAIAEGWEGITLLPYYLLIIEGCFVAGSLVSGMLTALYARELRVCLAALAGALLSSVIIVIWCDLCVWSTFSPHWVAPVILTVAAGSGAAAAHRLGLDRSYAARRQDEPLPRYILGVGLLVFLAGAVGAIVLAASPVVQARREMLLPWVIMPGVSIYISAFAALVRAKRI